MALDTYADLQTALLEWLSRPGDSLVSPSLPDMITLFEEEARDQLRTRFGEATALLTTTPNVATVATPAYFEGARELVLQADPVQILTYMTPEQMDAMWPEGTGAQPVNFTVVGTDFRFAPIPDAVYSIACDYVAGVPALSDDSPTNWLLTNYPSLYLFGTLAEAEAFVGEDERIALWIGRRDAAFERVKLADRKARWTGGGSLQIKTDTGNP